MIIFIKKRQIVCGILFCCFLVGMAAVLWQANVEGEATSVFEPREGVPVTVVIDPGHGGEDGGAVAGDGTVESQLNLEIAQKTWDLLRFAGQAAVMTRTEDAAIYSQEAQTLREKKVSDLQNRVAMVNGTENTILLSIHQNSLPSSPVTHRLRGALVSFFWFSK